jgi:hypothetical protein
METLDYFAYSPHKLPLEPSQDLLLFLTGDVLSEHLHKGEGEDVKQDPNGPGKLPIPRMLHHFGLDVREGADVGGKTLEDSQAMLVAASH